MKKLFLFSAVYLMTFALTIVSINVYAQKEKTTYIGVLSLKDNSLLEGELSLDFEEHTIKIIENSKTRLLSFSAVESLTMYDHHTQIRREFISLKHNELYEVVLAGELSLLRNYTINPQTFIANNIGMTYLLYNADNEIKVSFEKIDTEMEKIFQENIGLIRNVIKNKNYDTKNLQHIASLVRYHNQCKAKSLAKL